MDENNVVTATMVAADQKDGIATVEAPVGAENVKTEPAKTDKADTAEVDKLKAALSRAHSQAAEYKRQLREKQTETERAEAERAEQDKAMRDELETLRKEKTVTEYTNKALEAGFDADMAAQAANAMADGDMNAVFDCLKAFVEATKTRLENEALNRQPGLSTGVPPTKNTTIDSEMDQMRRWMGVPTHR